MKIMREIAFWAAACIAAAVSGFSVAGDGALNELHKIHIPGATVSIDWHPNSRTVALGGFAGMLVVVDATSGAVTNLHEDREVRAVRFSPDGRFLAVGKSFNKAHVPFVKLLDTNHYKTYREIIAPAAGSQSRYNNVSSISSIAFDADAKFIAIAGYQTESEAAVFRLENLGRGPIAVFSKRDAAVDFVAFQPGSDVLAVGRVPGEIELFSVSTGRLLRAIQAFDGLWSLKLLTFDPNGQRFMRLPIPVRSVVG
jgi:WD40 repeat protein